MKDEGRMRKVFAVVNVLMGGDDRFEREALRDLRGVHADAGAVADQRAAVDDHSHSAALCNTSSVFPPATSHRNSAARALPRAASSARSPSSASTRRSWDSSASTSPIGK